MGSKPEPETDPGPPVRIPVCDETVAAAVADLAAAVADLVRRPYAPLPSGTGAGHWVPAAANTAYPAALTGALGQNWNRPIQKIKLSISAAALVVVGVSNIVAGSASYGELVRIKAPGAGVYDFDYGQGLPPAALGGSGQFVYWSDTPAITVDVLVQHG